MIKYNLIYFCQNSNKLKLKNYLKIIYQLIFINLANYLQFDKDAHIKDKLILKLCNNR
jgi:hypothetical protein